MHLLLGTISTEVCSMRDSASFAAMLRDEIARYMKAEVAMGIELYVELNGHVCMYRLATDASCGNERPCMRERKSWRFATKFFYCVEY